MKNHWIERRTIYWGVQIFDDYDKEVTTGTEPVSEIDLPLKHHTMPVLAKVCNYFPKKMEKIKWGKMHLYACRCSDKTSGVYAIVGEWYFTGCNFSLAFPVDFQEYSLAWVDYHEITCPLTNEFTLEDRLKLDLSHSNIGIKLG